MKLTEVKKGDRFGRLMVLVKPQKRFDCGLRRSSQLLAVLVRCDCGTVKEVWWHHLRTGRVQSCGCLRREVSRQKATKHGMRKTRLYQTWNNMLRRCEDSTAQSYKYYGAKGITVCVAWHRFERFAAWALSHGYTDDLLIDRIRNTEGYKPSNCRWVACGESSRNRTLNTWGRHVQCSDGRIFHSARAAARQVGVSHVNILRVCHGKRKTSAGFGWTFIGEEETSDE